ncbi:MAG: DUF4013 domain-containing protein [Coriobacteriia bacterium]|nr:DUF4013 domain-containing protein [Coriobacteriia bacterium]
MDLGRSFGAPFKDQQWVNKTLLGGLWGLLGVTYPAVMGAQLDYIRKVWGGDETLPDWSDFGGKWVRGLLVGVAAFIYMLPAVVLYSIGFLPILFAAATGEDWAAGMGVGLTCLLGMLATVYVIGVSIFFFAAIVNYALTGNFGSMFAFGEIRQRIRSGGYLTAWLYALIISIGASIITSVLSVTYIGAILFPWVYYLAYMMMAHVLGQWAAQVYGGGGFAQQPVPAAPTPPAPPATPGQYQPPTAPQQPAAPPPPAAPQQPLAPPQPPAAPQQPPAPPAPPTDPSQQ